MKKALQVLLFGAIGLVANAQTITLDFTLGILQNDSASTLPDGALVTFIASSDTSFGAPTDASFVSGGDILIASQAFDSTTTGLAGTASITLADISLAQYPIAGYYLAVRWYPTLSTIANSPGSGTVYGEFGYGTLGNTLWIAPAAGSSVSYTFLTQSVEGTYLNSAGVASLSTQAIPEPSTYAMLAAGLLVVGFTVRRRMVRS